MPVISELAVALTVRGTQFFSAFRQAEVVMNRFSKLAFGVKAGVLAMRSAFVALGGAAGIGLFIRSSAETIDTLSKMSRRLGFSTQEMAGLSHAANLAGLSIKDVETAIRSMQKNIGAGGKKGGIFEALGVSATGSPHNQFLAVANAISRVADQNQRVKAASEAFGKSGPQMLSLIEQGAAGIKAAGDEARKMGLSFTRLQGLQVEAANDAMTKLRGIISGVGQSLAIRLAPFVEAVSAHFFELGTKANRLNMALDSLVTGIQDYTFKMFGYRDSITHIADEVADIVKGVARNVGGERVGNFADWILTRSDAETNPQRLGWAERFANLLSKPLEQPFVPPKIPSQESPLDIGPKQPTKFGEALQAVIGKLKMFSETLNEANSITGLLKRFGGSILDATIFGRRPDGLTPNDMNFDEPSTRFGAIGSRIFRQRDLSLARAGASFGTQQVSFQVKANEFLNTIAVNTTTLVRQGGGLQIVA